jgi:hypothetical protein
MCQKIDIPVTHDTIRRADRRRVRSRAAAACGSI